MNLLIEIVTGKTSVSVGACVSGNIYLIDGSSDETISSKKYLSNYIATDGISELQKNINLLSGGNIEDYESHELTIRNDSLFEYFAENDYSLNSSTIKYSIYDGTTVTPIWYGYIVDSYSNENLLTLSCESLSGSQKVLPSPLGFGYCSKLALPRETSITPKSIYFNVNGARTIYPKIVSTTSSNNPKSSASDYNSGYNYGVNRIYQSSGKDSIVISYSSSIAYTDYKHLKLKFLSGGNADKIYRIYSITESGSDSAGYTATIILKDYLESDDVRAFDRVTMYEGVSYYRLPDNVTSDQIYRVNAKSSSTFVSMGKGSYDFETINGKTYIAFYPSNNVYRSAPIKSVVISSDSTINTVAIKPSSSDYRYPTYNSTLDPALTINGDLSTFYDCNVALTSSHSSYVDLFVDIYPSDLSSFTTDSIYLGGFISTGLYNTKSDFYITTYLKTGEIYPCTNDSSATANPTSFKTIKESDDEQYWNACPTGDTSDANIINADYTRVYSDANTYTLVANSSSRMTFDSTQLQAIDLDADTYSDIDYIRLKIRKTVTSGSVADFLATIIYEVGLYTKNTIDDEQDNIYIDFLANGITPSVYAQKLFSYLGADVGTTGQDSQWGICNGAESAITVGGSDYYVYGGNYAYSYATGATGAKSVDVLGSIAKENLLALSQNPDGTMACVKLDVDGTVINAFTSDNIQSISEYLKDIDISNVINMPTITFKGLDANDYSLTVKDLTATFPTLNEFKADNSVMSSVFTFSDNFLEHFMTSNSITPYNFLQSLYTICLKSYNNNGQALDGSFNIDTIYLDMLDYESFNKDIVLNLVELLANRRKTLKIDVSLSTFASIKLGQRCSVVHPSLLSGTTLLGFIQAYSINVKSDEPKIEITLMIDSYINSGGTRDFFI